MFLLHIIFSVFLLSFASYPLLLISSPFLYIARTLPLLPCMILSPFFFPLDNSPFISSPSLVPIFHTLLPNTCRRSIHLFPTLRQPPLHSLTLFPPFSTFFFFGTPVPIKKKVPTIHYFIPLTAAMTDPLFHYYYHRLFALFSSISHPLFIDFFLSPPPSILLRQLP